MKKEAKQIIKELLQEPIYKSFKKYYGLNQTGKNDYEVGCIQAANAIMPVLYGILLELSLEEGNEDIFTMISVTKTTDSEGQKVKTSFVHLDIIRFKEKEGIRLKNQNRK